VLIELTGPVFEELRKDWLTRAKQKKLSERQKMRKMPPKDQELNNGKSKAYANIATASFAYSLRNVNPAAKRTEVTFLEGR